MKLQQHFIYLIIFCFLVSCSAIQNLSRIPAAEDVIDIVFDLDWTIVAENKNTSQLISKENIISVDGVTYRINDWALEMITDLSARSNVRISFFSGGKETRNTKLLSKLKLLDDSGKSFMDIAYKVKSFHDLDELPDHLISGQRFSDRYKKDLKKINKNLKNVIFIEDNTGFAIDNIQKRNMLWMGPTYLHFETLNDFPSLPLDIEIEKHVPKTIDEWFVGRNKLLFIWATLESALQPDNELPFIDSITKSSAELDLGTGEYNNKLKKLYREKFGKLKKVGFRKGRISIGTKCTDMIRSFL
jgi:hypothetical protein